MLATPELIGCWPLGYLMDPDGDNDEECGRAFEGGRDDGDEEDED